MLSNSKIKAFLECEEAAYHEHILKDYVPPTSGALSRGSLLDAIMTKQFRTTPDSIPNRAQLQQALASTYGDGSEHVDNLLVKNGSFDAQAKKVVRAANKLLLDPVVRQLMAGAEFQRHVEGEFCGYPFKGEIDIKTASIDGITYIIDTKKMCDVEDGWGVIYENGEFFRNQKMPWYDVYDYWMAFTLYKHLYEQELKQKKLPPETIKTGLLYATEQEPSNIGLVLLETDIKALTRIYTPIVKLVKALEKGDEPMMGRCGLCEWCRATSKVEIPNIAQVPVIRYQ